LYASGQAGALRSQEERGDGSGMKRALVGAAALVLLAACGGGGGVTKADYVKKANAVCHGAAKDFAALDIPNGDISNLPKAAAQIVALQRKALDELEKIKPPKADRPKIAKWIALVDQTIDQAELSAKSQKDGDIPRAVTANSNGAELDARADDLARAYGLNQCVHAATPPESTVSTTTTTAKPAAAP
jgi:hypothetical protein